jgi:hypothetical protein
MSAVISIEIPPTAPAAHARPVRRYREGRAAVRPMRRLLRRNAASTKPELFSRSAQGSVEIEIRKSSNVFLGTRGCAVASRSRHRKRDAASEILMHTLVHLVLALAAIPLVLMALLGLILIQTIDSSIEDESWSESDPGADREPSTDLTVIYQSTLIGPKKRTAATCTRKHSGNIQTLV